MTKVDGSTDTFDQAAVTITLNGSSVTSPSFYAPDYSGEAGQVLLSSGDKQAPYWTNTTNIQSGSVSNGGANFYPSVHDDGGVYLWNVKNGKNNWAIGRNGTKNELISHFYDDNGSWSAGIILLDNSNYSNYALPLTGGTVTGTITAPAFIGSLQGYATRAERSYRTYNDLKVYYYLFGGDTDVNWKKVASIRYDSNDSYTGATIKGIVYYFGGNYNQSEVQEYNFQVNNTFTGGNNLIVDQCQFRRAPGCPDIIRVVKIGTNNYELQIRQLEHWRKTAIQFTISSTNLIIPCEPVDSSNNSAISVSDLNDSQSLYAYKIKDSGDGRDLTFNYSADGLSSATWLAGWNGAELRAVSPSVITAGAATKLATARTFTIGHGSFTFDGSANVSLDTSKIFTWYTTNRAISWNDLPTGFTEMVGGDDAWSGTGNPTDMTGFYRWGGALTLNANGGAFAQMYFSHIGSSESGILYRTGWYSDKKGWARILDSNNYTSYCAKASHTHSYLPLSGGSLSGQLRGTSFWANQSSGENQCGVTYNGGSLYFWGNNSSGTAGIWDSKNATWIISRDTSTNGYNIKGQSVQGAVWNDYAEYRSQNETIEPGYITYCDDDGKLKKTTERLQKFEGVVSDTFGFSIGETDDCKTPLAVSGRALVYCDPEEEHFHSGDCVCAGPDGLAYRMTREEVIEFPDRIVGVVSEIPTYETWGTGNVEVNGRIWVKVK